MLVENTDVQVANLNRDGREACDSVTVLSCHCSKLVSWSGEERVGAPSRTSR